MKKYYTGNYNVVGYRNDRPVTLAATLGLVQAQAEVERLKGFVGNLISHIRVEREWEWDRPEP